MRILRKQIIIVIHVDAFINPILRNIKIVSCKA